MDIKFPEIVIIGSKLEEMNDDKHSEIRINVMLFNILNLKVI
jgi:hypothetical protein